MFLLNYRAVLNDRMCHVTPIATARSSKTIHKVFTITQDTIIVAHSVDMAMTLMRNGIERLILKLVTISLKLRIEIAQLYSRREPFIKLNAANNHRGVVGSMGRNIPKNPKAKDIMPIVFQTQLILSASCIFVSKTETSQ